MQWNTEKNAGFTDGEPWIAVNDNYKTINAEAAVKDPESVFFYYKKLVQLRHEVPVITDGVYKLLESAGSVSGEFVYLYPPGIPILAPGELVTPEILDALATCQKRNMEVQGMKDFSGIWLEICQDNVS